jgi:peptidoglycan hydrolase-like protein with peptidoglycan-binding domain
MPKKEAARLGLTGRGLKWCMRLDQEDCTPYGKVLWRSSIRKTRRVAMASSRPLLKKGSKGDAVETLQRALASVDYDPGGFDGIFGPNTERAVKEFQTNHGLAADGVVGPKTWAALEEAAPEAAL